MAPRISATEVVKLARREIGTREKGSNHTKYGRAWGLDGYAWCGQFVAWVFAEAGSNLRLEGISGAASTNLFDLQARRRGWKRVNKHLAKPGDVVFFDFGDLDGRGPDPANDNDHVGICSRRALLGTVRCVEGNTGSGMGGSQANGDGVFERTRNLSVVRHVYRPPYAALTKAMVARERAEAARKARTVAAAKAAKKAAEDAARARAKAARKALADKRAAKAAAGVVAVIAVGAGAGAVATQVGDGTGPAPKPAVTATPTVTHSPYAPPTTHAASPLPTPRVTLSRVLEVRRPAMRGRDVAAVRELIGVRPGTLYTPKVAAAVKRWQKSHGVKPADGEFGPMSARAAGWSVKR